MRGTSGATVLTADGAIGNSGKPIRLFSITFLAGAGGAGELVLRNGTAAGDTVWVQQDAPGASESGTINFGKEGILFDAGCFFDKDANVAAVVLGCRKEA